LIVLQAVCCTDGTHCCPEGTTCDVSAGKCNHGDLAVVDWIEKVPAIIVQLGQNILLLSQPVFTYSLVLCAQQRINKYQLHCLWFDPIGA
jgi:hypothetical protein